MMIKVMNTFYGDQTCLRALGKREYSMIIEDNFSYFSLKPYVVTPHLNRLDETVQMRGHSICFLAELKIIPNYHKNTPSYLELSFPHRDYFPMPQEYVIQGTTCNMQGL